MLLNIGEHLEAEVEILQSRSKRLRGTIPHSMIEANTEGENHPKEIGI